MPDPIQPDLPLPKEPTPKTQIRNLLAPIALEAKKSLPEIDYSKSDQFRQNLFRTYEMIWSSPKVELAEEVVDTLGLNGLVHVSPKGEVYFEVPPNDPYPSLFQVLDAALSKEDGKSAGFETDGLLSAIVMGMDPKKSTVLLDTLLLYNSPEKKGNSIENLSRSLADRLTNHQGYNSLLEALKEKAKEDRVAQERIQKVLDHYQLGK
jgi:hypothetical protein